jgi:hypothetical protein
MTRVGIVIREQRIDCAMKVAVTALGLVLAFLKLCSERAGCWLRYLLDETSLLGWRKKRKTIDV